MEFYTYLWLREDGTPYYVGKGIKKRAFTYDRRHGHKPPKDRSKIILQYWADEDTAFSYEMYLIDFWGRKDSGSGVLVNHTDGGRSPSGTKFSKKALKNMRDSIKGRPPISEETRQKMREAKLGKPGNRKGKKHSVEARKKLSIAHIGKSFSEDHKRKLSETVKRSWENGKRRAAAATTGV